MNKFSAALALMILISGIPALAETLTNRSIVALNAAGIDADTIIAKIHSSETKFDLSTEQIIALKKQGVPNSIIAAMVAIDAKGDDASPVAPTQRLASNRGASANLAVSRPAGIYLLQAGQLVRIEPNVSGQTKTGGFLGSALTYGIAKISIRVVLQGESARVKTREAEPTFYFYLPEAARTNASSFDEGSSTAPTSPDQFSLVRMNAKKDSREARVGRANVAGVQSGVVDKDRVNFTFDETRPGVFSVHPTNPLPAGEYCFVMIGGGGASVTKFFDFSVQQ
jgi:hypothetical protein